MTRLAGFLFAFGALLAAWNDGSGSPVTGRRSLGSKNKFDGSGSFGFKETFRGGERACVVVRGNNPSDNLAVHVFDQDGHPVVQVENRGDLVAAIWYPPRDALYHIKVMSPESKSKSCYIALK